MVRYHTKLARLDKPAALQDADFDIRRVKKATTGTGPDEKHGFDAEHSIHNHTCDSFPLQGG